MTELFQSHHSPSTLAPLILGEVSRYLDSSLTISRKSALMKWEIIKSNHRLTCQAGKKKGSFKRFLDWAQDSKILLGNLGKQT